MCVVLDQSHRQYRTKFLLNKFLFSVSTLLINIQTHKKYKSFILFQITTQFLVHLKLITITIAMLNQSALNLSNEKFCCFDSSVCRRSFFNKTINLHCALFIFRFRFRAIFVLFQIESIPCFDTVSVIKSHQTLADSPHL